MSDGERQVLAVAEQCATDLARWANAMREVPGRFRWSAGSTRPANVVATRYLVMALRRAGIYQQVITPDDAREGIAWIRGMARGHSQYDDPALCDRQEPDWTLAAEQQECVNQYALGALDAYSEPHPVLPSDLPPGWPQREDGPEATVAWIKSRPYAQNAWGACSHGARMGSRLLDWYKEGQITLDPLVESIRFWYDIQDPETGLWGTPQQPRHVRINGVFKLMGLLRDRLDLPLPHAQQIIDQVLAEFARADYEATLGGCDELDNWYVIAELHPLVPDYRRDEIRHLAAQRLLRIVALFGQPDGGLSFFPGRSNAGWNGLDMGPSRPEGDAMGASILGSALCICIELAGLRDRTAYWQGPYRAFAPESDDLRRTIREAVARRMS